MADTTPQQHAEALEKRIEIMVANAIHAVSSAFDDEEFFVSSPDQAAALNSIRPMAHALLSLLDERKRLREALSEYVKAFEAHHITNTHGARDFDFTGRIAAIAREALK